MTTTKAQMLDKIARTWQEFQEALKSVPPQRMDEPGLEGQWSVKDLVGHITAWEVEMVRVVQEVYGYQGPDGTAVSRG